MIKIITTKQMQQKIGQISAEIDETAFIITNRGMGKLVILPYFDGCNEMIEEYMEDCEMYRNKDALKKELQESLDSGLSDIVI
jgi:hypothetical protein